MSLYSLTKRYLEMSSRTYLVLITLATVTIVACQPMHSKQQTINDRQRTKAEKSDDYKTAAERYIVLAESVKGKRQASLYLQAGQAFWRSNQLKAVVDALSKIDHKQLSKSQQHEAIMLTAKLALAQDKTTQALDSLASIDTADANTNIQRQVLELTIIAYQLTESWLAKANSHLTIANLLPQDKRKKNQDDLWQTLMMLTPETLLSSSHRGRPAIDNGWFTLAHIVQSYRLKPHNLMIAVANWQHDYPNHPADPKLYNTILEAGTRLPQQLINIAVLLPNDGPFSNQANAIKQGIIAAHFSARSDAKLHFFDITIDPSGKNNTVHQYQKAVNNNIDIVIGPLDKSSISQLADISTLPVPVLALNRLPDIAGKKNLFQFGLAPEDDITTITNYALEQNFQRAIVIAPNNNWGERIASIFSRQWLNKGGVLLGRAHYNSNNSDFSAIITPLLGLDASKKRAKLLKKTLSIEVKFEPRRRQDIDFIFLVARPLKARQLMAQLKFHRADNLPLMATSHAYEGYENAQQNLDLNHLIINDIPWILNQAALTDPAYIALRDNEDKHFNQFIRLYALGVDAYRLVAKLNQLSRLSSLTFQGATGGLSINELGQITRQMSQAVFRKGKIKPTPDK